MASPGSSNRRNIRRSPRPSRSPRLPARPHRQTGHTTREAHRRPRRLLDRPVAPPDRRWPRPQSPRSLWAGNRRQGCRRSRRRWRNRPCHPSGCPSGSH